jgi:hypothetical protein
MDNVVLNSLLSMVEKHLFSYENPWLSVLQNPLVFGHNQPRVER